ncbi:MAG: ABC transporter substrate-binding protein [Canibacter sp.]
MKVTTYRASCALIAAVGVILPLAACSPSSGPASAGKAAEMGISDDDYSLDALIEAAQEEGSLTVYDVTGRIEESAASFEEEYGIKTTGVKAKANEQQEIMIRESQSGSVKGDLFIMTDAPTVASQLIPDGIGYSWIPPDIRASVPDEYSDPVAIATEVDAWTYNSEVYGDECPIDNVWAATDSEWKGKIALPDPQLRSDFFYWLNQVEEHDDGQMAQAYEEYFGESLDESKGSATEQWAVALAGNSPILKQSGGDVAEAVGAEGQAEPPIALVSTGEYRMNEDSGYHLALCGDVEPWAGRAYTKNPVIASGTSHPNAAKLFVHYLFTEEGIAPQLADGKLSTSSEVPPSSEERSGIAESWENVFVPNPETLESDFSRLVDWQDLWTKSAS